MKVVFEQVASNIESAFLMLELNQASFEAPYHFHGELELTLILNSRGKRYVGGNVSEYQSGDLVLVGENLPHCWINEKNNDGSNHKAIVIQFQKNFAGDGLLNRPEFLAIQKLLEKSKSGLQIRGKTRRLIGSKISSLKKLQGFKRFVLFLEILNCIAESDEKEEIDPLFSESHLSFSETDRFRQVFEYLITNFHQEISLKVVAEIANLTPTAFCRYFKKHTHKTLVEFLVECRINDASILLRNTDKPVLEICYLCGFGNLSYFNKSFKKHIGNTPLQYRNHFKHL